MCRRGAKHDGKLKQCREQSCGPVFLFIRQHPPPPSLLSFSTVQKHPSSTFHTPLRSERAAEDQRAVRGLSVPALLEGNSGVDQQLWDNSTKTSWSSLAPLLPVQINKQKAVNTDKKATHPASRVFTYHRFFLTAYFARSPFRHSKGRFCLREEFSGRRTIQSRPLHKTIMRYHLTFGRIIVGANIDCNSGKCSRVSQNSKSQKRGEIRNP